MTMATIILYLCFSQDADIFQLMKYQFNYWPDLNFRDYARLANTYKEKP